METETTNPLLSAERPSDSDLRILLHPLVLLTISDYITRHTIRRREGPIAGALLGQQNGREISIDHAFEAKVNETEDGSSILDEAWFTVRLQQYKDVHKDPSLELVGWFTTTPASGPQQEHLPIHRQVMKTYNESALLLAFHPSRVLDGATTGGKLPLMIYESVYENRSNAGRNERADIDKGAMQIDEPDVGKSDVVFKELPYSIETGEAEMISVDFVAKGGGNATAIDSAIKKNGPSQAPQSTVTVGSGSKGKEKEEEIPSETDNIEDSLLLSAEDEELITSLTSRANAVKMLHARIQLLRTYLANLPPSYLSASSPNDAPSIQADGAPALDFPTLRSIQALVNRLPLLMPADKVAFEEESLSEKSDVSLVALLGSLGTSIRDTRELGRKFHVVDAARGSSRKGVGIGAGVGDDYYPPFGGSMGS